MTKTILFLAGSARQGSLNKALAAATFEAAKQHIAKNKLNVKPVFLDLNDFKMPIYDGDCEGELGLPDTARELKAHFVAADGFFLASPEYNGSLTALLKNAIDWISRPSEGDARPLAAFWRKYGLIGSATPGPSGGVRGLTQLRLLLGNIGVKVFPEQLQLPQALSAFDEKGQLKDQTGHAKMASLVAEFIDEVAR